MPFVSPAWLSTRERAYRRGARTFLAMCCGMIAMSTLLSLVTIPLSGYPMVIAAVIPLAIAVQRARALRLIRDSRAQGECG